MAAKGKFTENLHPRGHGGKFIRGLVRIQTKRDRDRATSTLARFRRHTPARDYHTTHGLDERERLAVRRYLGGGYRQVNAALREGRDHPDVASVRAAFRPLQHDLVVARHLDLAALGVDDPDGLRGLIGRKITDRSFQVASLRDRDADADVVLHIAVPKGVPAALSETGQILLEPDTQLAVVDAAANGHGGWDVHAVLLKKPVPRKAPAQPAGGPGQDGDLARLTVPQLQAKVREQGGRPGRRRKAELIALLQGGSGSTEKPKPSPNGEPVKKAKAAEKKPVVPEVAELPQTGPGSGRNLFVGKSMDEAAREVQAAARTLPEGSAADRELRAIQDMQGFSGIPQVVSTEDMDRLVASGGVVELHRGVTSTRDLSAAEIQEQFRTGNAFGGYGMYGNGYYFTTSREMAEFYTDGEPGSLLRVGLHKDARVALWTDLPFDTSPSSSRAQTWDDAGRLLAMQGYDALRIPNSKGPEWDIVVVLNRTAAVAEQATPADTPASSGKPVSAQHIFDLVDDFSPDDVEPLINAGHAIWGGQFAGLSVEVHAAEPAWGGRGALFTGTIIDAGGSTVGRFARTLRKDEDGQPFVEHTILTLDPRMRGQGFAEQFNANAENWYRSAGVGRIELHADIDVGGYTWARQGYDWRDGKPPDEIVQRLVNAAGGRTGTDVDEWRVKDASETDYETGEYVREFQIIDGDGNVIETFDNEDDARDALTDYQNRGGDAYAGQVVDPEITSVLDRLEAGEYVSPYELSQLGRQPGDIGPEATWPGKLALLGSDWMAVKWLE